MAGVRLRPYSGKIRTRSLILFLFSLALGTVILGIGNMLVSILTG
jgi:hypothetical protein